MKTKGPKRPKRQRLTMLKNIFMLFYYHNTCSRIDNAECLFVDDDTKWMPMDDKMLHFHLYQFVKRVMLLFFLISIWQNENPFQFHLFFFCLFYLKSMPNFVYRCLLATQTEQNRGHGDDME